MIIHDHFNPSAPELPVIHIPSTACDVISFNGQWTTLSSNLCRVKKIFQTILEWAQFSQGH